MSEQIAACESRALLAIESAYGRAIRLIGPALSRLREEMDSTPTDNGKIPLIWLYMHQRLERVKQSIFSHLNQFAISAMLLLTDSMRQATQLGISRAQSHLQASDIAEQDQAQEAPDNPLASLFNGFGREAAQKAEEALVRGVISGSTPAVIASEVQQALGISRNRALVIARDQINDVYRRAILRVYRANSDMVAGWQWRAELSPHTCIACILMHGTRHPLSEEMHEHVCGRCVPIPFMRVGAGSNQPTSGLDWFRQQSEATQKQILGPGKFAAWQQGQFSLSDAVAYDHDPKWGTSIREKSLKELLNV